VILIDIRNPGEVELGRIPGAVNIPLPNCGTGST
jgi:rhodanese-related sulfurtransferase